MVGLLTGSVVRIWATLEAVLLRHQTSLSKSERTMRMVRVQLPQDALPSIGKSTLMCTLHARPAFTLQQRLSIYRGREHLHTLHINFKMHLMIKSGYAVGRRAVP